MGLGLAANQLNPDVTVKKMVYGYLSKSVAGSSNVTLTDSEATYAQIECTGALTGSIDLLSIDEANMIWIYNNTSGAYTLTVKPTGGSGVAITQGTRCLIGYDGAGNAYKWTAEL